MRKEQIIRFLFSLMAGFGFAVLIFFVAGSSATALGVESEDVGFVVALVEGTIGFGVVTWRIYGYLKSD